MDIENSGRYPEPELSPDKVFGAVLPHAGHLYSGYQTIPLFQLIRSISQTYVVLVPYFPMPDISIQATRPFPYFS